MSEADLDAELGKTYFELDTAKLKIERLMFENTRMRAALDKLSDFRANHILNINQAQDIARAAREELK